MLQTTEHSASLTEDRDKWKLRPFCSAVLFCSVLFYSVLKPSSIRGLATPWTYFLHLSVSFVILTDSSNGSPVHVLMLSIQDVRGLPRLHAPGIVPCIISFSSWCDHSMLASLLRGCLAVLSLYSDFVKNPLICFLCCPWNLQNLSKSFHHIGVKTCFFILSESPAFTAVRCYRPQRFH